MPSEPKSLPEQVKELTPGATVRVEIPRSPQFLHLNADVTACLATPNQTLELIALAFQSRMTAQIISMSETDGSTQAALEGAPALVELAALRMNGELALDTAARLIEFGLNFKIMNIEQIEKRFSQIPLKISIQV